MRTQDPLLLTSAREDASVSVAWAVANCDFWTFPWRSGGQTPLESRRTRQLASASSPVDELRGQGSYHSLRERLRADGSIPESGFRLSAQALANHLRWT